MFKPVFYLAVFTAALLGNAAVSMAAEEPSVEEKSAFQFELSQTEYLEKVFSNQVPAAKRVWLRGELKQKIEAILQHRVGFLRTQYWQKDQLSVWILDEIGKEQPITIGVLVAFAEGQSTIQEVKVLAYRESRGWEVKHEFFTRQFQGLTLKGGGRKPTGLNKSIDGITGATLSVRALKKVAQIALILDQNVRSQTP